MNSTDSDHKLIRTELLAHNVLFEQQIPAIQTTLLSLEKKGRSPTYDEVLLLCLKGLAKRCSLRTSNRAHTRNGSCNYSFH